MPRAMLARITIHIPDAPAKVSYLEPGRSYVVGRSDDCDIVVDHPEVSRQHARIGFGNGTWHIADLGSKNGVSVAGSIVEKTTLRSKAWLSLGELMVRFEPRTEQQVENEKRQQQRRFATSVQLLQNIKPSLGIRPLLKRVLDSVLQLTDSEKGFALLAGGDGDMHVICFAGPELALTESARFSGSVGAVQQVLNTSQPVVVADTAENAPLMARPSIVANQVRALLCLPLVALDRTIGVIYADSTKTGKVFTELDLEILDGLIDHAATALAVAQLEKEIGNLDSVLAGDNVNDALQRHKDSIPGYGVVISSAASSSSNDTIKWSRFAAGLE